MYSHLVLLSGSFIKWMMIKIDSGVIDYAGLMDMFSYGLYCCFILLFWTFSEGSILWVWLVQRGFCFFFQMQHCFVHVDFFFLGRCRCCGFYLQRLFFSVDSYCSLFNMPQSSYKINLPSVYECMMLNLGSMEDVENVFGISAVFACFGIYSMCLETESCKERAPKTQTGFLSFLT